MGKQRLTLITLGVGVLILVVVFFFASTTIRRSGYIQLPEQTSDTAAGDGGYHEGSSTVPMLTVTTDTVQQVIATMERPESYARNVSITTYWGEESSTDTLNVAVYGELTRIDTPLFGGSIRHLLTNGINTAIWFDEETDYRVFPSGNISSDMEQRIPTYEDILQLPKEEIATAVYGQYEGHYCISVLTSKNDLGQETAYWISLESGLLIAAEVWQGEELIYRMTALSLGVSPQETDLLLPDGTALQSDEPPVIEDGTVLSPEKDSVSSAPEKEGSDEVVSPVDLVV